MQSKYSFEEMKELLESYFLKFHQPAFIEQDPISIPHLFSRKEDIEIAGFFAAVLAWGQRKVILQKSKTLLAMMDMQPFAFVMKHQESDLKAFLHFKHRTFNADDALYCIHFLRFCYERFGGLEQAFSQFVSTEDRHIKKALVGFSTLFMSLPEAPRRTAKHIPNPEKGSAAKRLCMYLRWMVRQDEASIDFGIWRSIKPSQLVCPCDVHVGRVANYLGLLGSTKLNWEAAVALTEHLKLFDAEDPVKYDFALFGLGVSGEL